MTDQRAHPRGAREAWWARLELGGLGEVASQPSTWVYDGMWRAAAEEENAERWARILAMPDAHDSSRP